MTGATPLISSVNAGEFGPRMMARVDMAKYGNACEVLENCFALPQGAAMRRPGTRFVAPAKFADKAVRLVPFEFSTTQAYQIEAGDGYFRFFRDHGQIVAAATDVVVANGDFVAGIVGWSDQSTGAASIGHDGDLGRMNLVGAASAVAHGEQSVTTGAVGTEHVVSFAVYGGDVTLRIGTTSIGGEVLADESFAPGFHTRAFTPGASPFFLQFLHDTAETRQVDDVALLNDGPVEVASPYSEAELFQLKYAQSADVLFIAHPDHRVHSLTRRGHESWSVTAVDFVDGPYLDENADNNHTLTPSGTTGAITITASRDTFVATDVGRLVRLKVSAAWGYAKITGFTDAQSVAAVVLDALDGVAATAAWRLGVWSDTTGYPRAVTFYEQRFWAAGATQFPQRIDGTRIGAFETFTPGVNDDDAVSYTMSADKVNAITWLSPGDSLAVGTVGGEWIVQSSDRNDPITPTNVQIKLNETVGSADVQPARVGPAVLFAARGGQRLHEFAFSLEADGFRAPDMTILAEHITGGGLRELAYQHKPDSILWCVREDGQLACFTYNRPEDVLGWSRQVTRGAFESVAVIPGAVGDEVWCVTRRDVGGGEKRFIEFFEDIGFGIQADAFFVDSGLSYDGGNSDPAKRLWLKANDWAIGATATLAADPGVFGGLETGIWQLASGADFVRVELGLFVGLDEVTVTIRHAVAADRVVAAVPVSLRNKKTANWADRTAGLVSVVSGLDHLDGEVVSILADGAVHPARTVQGGSVSLAFEALKVHVGLGYTSTWRSVRSEAGARLGTALGQVKRIHRVTLDLLRSAAPKLGGGDTQVRRLKWRDVNDLMDAAPPLISGERSVKFEKGFATDPRITWIQDLPLPTLVRAVVPHMRTYER